MAAKAAKHAAQRKAAEKAAEAAVREARGGYDETGLPGHEGHHIHVQGSMLICSCGTGLGCFSFIPDPRIWSDDPAVRAAAEREEADWRAWISCWICGQPGVTANDVSWPPRTIGPSPPLPS
jgi:hypothetical protein